ncbi:nuclear transport factor 2 family protein [Micromonospora sp. CPCC 205371]|nr:nuclear transport factor 2 family protein [Micromonospora sp. CPCC 205371]
MVVDIVTSFFHAVEAGDWDRAAEALADPVDIAHGDNRQTLTRDHLVSQWRQSHKGLTDIRYRPDPVHVDVTGDLAMARFACHITLGAGAAGIDGSYTVHVERHNGSWLIRSLRHDAT